MVLRRIFSALAHLSLGLAWFSMLPGCLIEDPPPYAEPQKTPPWLDLRRAVPFIDQVLVNKSGDTVQFNVPVRSEDAGDLVLASLLVDYKGEGSIKERVITVEVEPSTFDDMDRAIVFPWTIPNFKDREGCHRLTLMVTHASNVSFEDFPEPFDKTDLAVAVWWINIDTEAEASSQLLECPGTERRQ
jgi:hypothetical protein